MTKYMMHTVFVNTELSVFSPVLIYIFFSSEIPIYTGIICRVSIMQLGSVLCEEDYTRYIIRPVAAI